MTQPQLPKPPVTLEMLSGILPGCTLVGDGSVSVSDLVHPMMVSSPDELVLIIDPQALQVLSAGVVKAAVVAKGIPVPEGALAGYLEVERPRHALAYLLNVFNKPLHAYSGVHPTAVVESSAQVHPSVSIGACSYVGENAQLDEGSVVMSNVTVGAGVKMAKNCILHAGVRLGERVMLGNNVIVQHNASIGADGFSFVTPEKGSVEAAKSTKSTTVSDEHINAEIIRINSIGTVILEDNVEIGPCTAIDRSTLGATLIKKGTKVGSLVSIGHNNTIGENCLVISQVGLSGSCNVGDRAVLAGQVGVADHINIGEDAIVMAKSGIMRDVEAKSVVIGIPAQPAKDALRSMSLVNKLGDMRKEMRALKSRLDAMEQQAVSSVEAETAAV